MAAADTVASLTRFAGRGAGTDAERRAARWLAGEIATPRRSARVQTFWSRPNWAAAHAWHALLALAGSLVAIPSPRAGAAIVLAALLCLLVDALTGISPGRRLSPQRASQNVISPPPDTERTARLIVTANYDAGRTGIAYHPLLRRPAAAGRRALGPLAAGWRAWLALDITGLLIIALVRSGGNTGRPVAIVQLVLTVGLILGLALLTELAVSPFGPAASDNASGVGVALALVRALDVSPPRHLSVELVLTGAGAGTGLQRHLRAERPGPETVVLGLAACGHGEPRFWIADGSLLAARFSPGLIELAGESAAAIPGAGPHRGRGSSPALPARRARLAAITLGALDARGLPPASHLPQDTADTVQAPAMDRVLALALGLVDALDAELERDLGDEVAQRGDRPPEGPSAAAPATVDGGA
ncbi:MAG TPA: hypothetical protein VFN55_09605 [Solirubrobacteraceae bacterium]|nr:hypothetical protein [Solirubrobacteraceae bacterium]